MKDPKLEAKKIIDRWQLLQTDNQYPIDCIKIAESLGLQVIGCELNDDFLGLLKIHKGKPILLYNKKIKEDGRKNFTIAHEIGHYVLHLEKLIGNKELRKNILYNNELHDKETEKEADLFAAHLLMPETDVIAQIKNKPIDFNLIKSLSTRYNTSITATTCHVVSMSITPLAAILVTSENQTKWYYKNQHFNNLLKLKRNKQHEYPKEYTDYQLITDSELWIKNEYSNDWILKYSCLEMEEYSQKLFILEGNRQ
ncbi:TPA: ImmA/IrrE family metallo-endopeptidase [Proteus mirabilis]